MFIQQLIKNHSPLSLISTALLMTITASTVTAETLKNAIIGTNSISIVEILQEDISPTLTAIDSTLLPLDDASKSISTPIKSDQQAWTNAIGKNITAVHRHIDLKFKGLLIDVDSKYFTLEDRQQRMQLIIDDFYLIHQKVTDAEQANSSKNKQIKTHYLSKDIQWQPQLSLLIHNNTLSLIQNANIANHSSKLITLDAALLQLRQFADNISQENKIRLSSIARAETKVSYADSEIVFPLPNMTTLNAHSTNLIQLTKQDIVIEGRKSLSEVTTYASFLGSKKLTFNQALEATLDDDAIPGSYQVFWQNDEHLLPSGNVQLDNLRQGNTLLVQPNQNQDITGQLTLISASSRKLPSTQVWQLELKNNSQQENEIEVLHKFNAVVQSFELLANTNVNSSTLFSDKTSADQQRVRYLLPAQGDVKITYSVTLSK